VAVMLAVMTVKMAGMDGNRTHPGRLNSAPQTVLKIAFLTCTRVCGRSRKIGTRRHQSADVRQHSQNWLSAWLSITPLGES
jgi:hypothetical protein